MTTFRPIIFIFLISILISGCTSTMTTTVTFTPATATTQPQIVFTATKVDDTTPVPAASVTQSLSPTKDNQGWETPASEVLLMFNPTKSPPPAAKFTETVAKRKFLFVQPEGFRFRDTSYSSMMENKEKNVLIHLELHEHNGKSNALVFLKVVLDGKIYKAIDHPVPYTLANHEGWIVNIESPGIYDNGKGQIIIVDLDASNVFYAIGLAKGDTYETNGKPIFTEVIDSISFLETK